MNPAMNKPKESPPTSLDALTRRIQRDFSGMPPQFQVGARYLMDFPADIPVASMRRIAAQAGVQPATMVRLAHSLGFGGWEDLKNIFVQSLRRAPKRYADQARRVVSGGGRDTLNESAATLAENMKLLEHLNADRLPLAAKLLAEAAHVHVAGFRASFSPAYALQYLYRLFRPTVTLLRGDAGLLEMELRSIKRDDAVVIVGFAPYSQEGQRVTQAARKAGGRLIAICDSVVAPIALKADCVLVFPTETPSFFPSTTAAMALVEILVEQVLTMAGRKAIDQIQRTEQQLRDAGAYLEPK